MKTSITLQGILLVITDFRNKLTDTAFIELIEHYDQKNETSTLNEATDLFDRIQNLSWWGKLHLKHEIYATEADTLQKFCIHYTELTNMLGKSESLYEINEKIRTLVESITTFKKAPSQYGTQTILNGLRVDLRRILDTIAYFGLTEQNFGLAHEEKGGDWTVVKSLQEGT